jgi:hypothetical protein
MLLDFKGANGPPVAQLLHRDSDVGAVLDVDPHAQEEGRHIEDDDHHGDGRCRQRPNTLDEITHRGLSRRHQNSHRLQRDSRQQGDRHCEVKEEQRPPERSALHKVDYGVHRISSPSEITAAAP